MKFTQTRTIDPYSRTQNTESNKTKTEQMNQIKFSHLPIILCLMSALTMSCTRSAPHVSPTTTIENSQESLTKPYVILISLDGFRWDYIQRFNPPTEVKKIIGKLRYIQISPYLEKRS